MSSKGDAEAISILAQGMGKLLGWSDMKHGGYWWLYVDLQDHIKAIIELAGRFESDKVRTEQMYAIWDDRDAQMATMEPADVMNSMPG